MVSAVLFIAARLFSPSIPLVEPAMTRLNPAAGNAIALSGPLSGEPGLKAQGLKEQGLSAHTAKTIYIKGNSEVIVGQLARIPTESGSIADIKTVSDIDNRAARELLSIISKY